MEERKIRDMITKETVCNHSIDDLISLIDEDPDYLNIKPSELKYSMPKDFGEYEVIENREWVVVYSKDTWEAKAIMTVYELHGYRVFPENGLTMISTD